MAAPAYQFRLTWRARLLLGFCNHVLRPLGLRLPHGFVYGFVGRSWLVREGSGPWRACRVDGRGRVYL